jgi:hypothetical protein
MAASRQFSGDARVTEQGLQLRKLKLVIGHAEDAELFNVDDEPPQFTCYQVSRALFLHLRFSLNHPRWQLQAFFGAVIWLRKFVGSSTHVTNKRHRIAA